MPIRCHSSPLLTLVGTLLPATLAANALAAPIDGAYSASAHSDHATAATLAPPLADEGHPAAQYYLALPYETGHGLDMESVEAYRRYAVAAARTPTGSTEFRSLAVQDYYRVSEKKSAAQIAQALAAESQVK